MISKEDMLYQSPTAIVKASRKDHRTSSFQSSEVIVGAVSHIYMYKLTSISGRIKKFW